MAIIKLIPMDLAGQLPNYVVRNNAEVDEAFEEIPQNRLRDWKQLWFCVNNVSRSSYSVGGRFIPGDASSNYSDILEQVWHTSPRMIERLNRSAEFPYVRAERPIGCLSFKINESYIPKGYPLTDERLRAEYADAVRNIFERREAWQLFVSYVLSLGISVVSLEYKVTNGRFSFIDWDTENDQAIV